MAATSCRTRAGHAAFWCVSRMFTCLCFGASIPHARRRAGASGSHPVASVRHNNSWQQTHTEPAPVMRRFGVCLACSHDCALTLQFRTQYAAQVQRAAISSRPHGTAALGSKLMPNQCESCSVLVCASHVCMPVLLRFNFARKTPLRHIRRLSRRVRAAQQLLAATSRQARAGHAASIPTL